MASRRDHNALHLIRNTLLVILTVAMGTEQQSLAAARRLLQECNKFRPQHCGDVRRAGQTSSGVYTVFHKAAGPSGQDVYCDMDTDGGGWTVIQRRGQYGNNVYYFKRDWKEYAEGFGDPLKEFWIGNHALHALTYGKDTMSLRVTLGNITHDIQSVDYESVHIDNEEAQFRIQVGRYLGPRDWDGMVSSNRTKFTTPDKDNDSAEYSNCAMMYHGPWWHSDCFSSNLNGLNLNGDHDSMGEGIIWYEDQWYTFLPTYSYQRARMMIRPANFALGV